MRAARLRLIPALREDPTGNTGGIFAYVRAGQSSGPTLTHSVSGDPVTRSKRTSLWIQICSGFSGRIWSGVFAVLGRFLGWCGRARGAVEQLPVGANQGLGGVPQGPARSVEAGSVKKYGPASKGLAPRQKVWGLRQKVSSKRQKVWGFGRTGLVGPRLLRCGPVRNPRKTK